jgi:transcriptional regulator with XRE-family HTH domain
MEFGKWIQSVRKEQKLDIKTLAERSSVDTSTISRVENSRTQVSLSIAVRLSEGLGLNASDVFQAWNGKPLVETEWRNTALSTAVPTTKDVEMFLQGFQKNKGEGEVLLSELLNKVVSLQDHAEGMLRGDSSQPFVPKDIYKLLSNSPVYRFEIHYPPGIQAEDILAIYTGGGALTMTDIGEYIKKVRREKHITLAKLENAASISASVISRLESGSLDQVKLIDVLMLDNQLEQEGKLFDMYWSVCKFNERVERWRQSVDNKKGKTSVKEAEQTGKLVYLYITAHRWLQCMHLKELTRLGP